LAGFHTASLIPQNEFPGQEVALYGRKLPLVEVQIILALPQVPSLLHFSHIVALSILNSNPAVDEVHGPPEAEDDLAACHSNSVTHCGLDVALQPQAMGKPTKHIYITTRPGSKVYAKAMLPHHQG
jgi:hypothetical protein